MKRKFYLTGIVCLSLLTGTGILFGQDDEDKPVRAPYATISLIDNATTLNLNKGELDFEIQHRFSQIKEIADLFGIYGAANTRLAGNYGITDKIQVGFGTTRNYKLQDLNWKYSILTQTRSGKIPVSLTYYGNAVLDARSSDNFGPEESFKFIHRLSYLTQLIVSRKFGERVTIQTAPTFVYNNSVPEGYNNANLSLNFGGRFMVLGYNSIILEYDQPLLMPDQEIYPNIAAGIEIGTSTHAFRVFVSNYDAIVKNRNVTYNARNPLDGDFQFGFNISIRF